jgi:hypothetical protein
MPGGEVPLTAAERGKSVAPSLIDLLAFVPAGKATVTVAGRTVLAVDADAKTMDVEADGAREVGISISDLVKAQGGTANMLEGSMHAVGVLSRLGWKVTLYADGEKILSVGKGVSRLTGGISVNPLGLRKLRRALK